MRGYAVPRKAGWDTHGLPVEVEVEKQLGITAKRQIEEEVGIAEFTRLCRQSVRNYVDEWKTLTDRIGYWIDIDDAYWTFAPEYVESVWWNLKSLWDQGLLYEDIKVVPYCPRCGTALAATSWASPTSTATWSTSRPTCASRWSTTGRPPPAPGRAGPRHLAGLALVAWTTTPWTLLSNTGAAVGPDLDVRGGRRRPRRRRPGGAVFGEGAVADHRVAGRDLVGLRYERPFDDVAPRPGRPPATAGGWCPAPSWRPTRGPASCTWPRPSVRSTARWAARTACPPSTRSAPTAASPPRCRG